MKTTAVIFTTLIPTLWAGVIMKRSPCMGVGLQGGDRGGHKDVDPSKNGVTDYPAWVKEYLNDPNVICGYLYADESKTDPFQLRGFYDKNGGYYIPALWELHYYPEAPTDTFVQDGGKPFLLPNPIKPSPPSS